MAVESGRALSRNLCRAAALWLAAAGIGHAAVASAAAPATSSPAECRISGMAHAVLCGSVQRPLDPARPEGVKIAVHYVVVPAMARRKHADPVFVLAGGPGQSAISLAPAVMPLYARLNNRRDIVFVDQRGTGRSAPLICDDPAREPLAAQADTERRLQRLADCRAALQKLPHGDLRFFTTILAMQDLDAVRQVLGAERLNLVGASYGTRAALDYLRQFPAHVRRSVIDGVAPADMALPTSFSTDGQAALDALLASCDVDLACRRSFPALRADWARLLARLPEAVSARHPLTGALEHFTLSREMVLDAVRGPLYAPALAAALPAAITDAANGRHEGLIGLSTMLAPRSAGRLAMGMHLSVVCAEDLPLMTEPASGSASASASASASPSASTATATPTPTPTPPPAPPPSAARDFGDSSAGLYRRMCRGWPRGEVPAAFYQIAPSASPVLVLSGGLDPVTPPRHGARVAAALGVKAQHIVVPHAGHGVMMLGCMRDAVYRFIDGGDDQSAPPIDASCATSIPRPPAFVPLSLSPSPAPEASR